ncbi:hypothetical protein LTR91_000870 [Friedmanniomyces endolithicus]|uniref:Uncharacterized protein n=1 Tax=Friedmanniomyces endolithicus TaxID=329885 RepID=A0AAN6L1K5_9PEZI|nr:hypothetical protein LTR94_009155 [Friedmanniomyces endolithicus]KAK0796949.1 hypothetical protein LTR38_008360 [Friedmanniomyces endolithicus]KAK0803188.1 hypothetical protein LTR59_004751 [Friedmanniomyces endolithicus]KAK0810770.1 hypothetical protein LTR75_005498 [Friedmanniomyces endolithicus]KAK0849630.1 hypothetical protein LTR03_005048 [Friedmanniomyces endolithicus]
MDDEIPTPSSEGTDSLSDLKPRPLNFSRPRNFSRPKPVSVDSKERLHHDRSGTAQSTRSITAFHNNNNASREQLPTEPRFSIDSNNTDYSPISEPSSAASEFAWDGALGELRSRRRPNEYDSNQRYSKGSSLALSHSGDSSTTAVASNGSDAPILASELTSSSSAAPPAAPPTAPTLANKLPRILKSTPPVQKQQYHHQPQPPQPQPRPTTTQRNSIASTASRASTATGPGASRGDWEDSASHHTVSVAGDNDSDSKLREEGNSSSTMPWSSSEYDVSGLSPSEIRKLRKKGINPALYAEMKAARKGKGKWVGPLVGNTFIG